MNWWQRTQTVFLVHNGDFLQIEVLSETFIVFSFTHRNNIMFSQPCATTKSISGFTVTIKGYLASCCPAVRNGLVHWTTSCSVYYPTSHVVSFNKPFKISSPLAVLAVAFLNRLLLLRLSHRRIAKLASADKHNLLRQEHFFWLS
jgi:hypothetical protein